MRNGAAQRRELGRAWALLPGRSLVPFHLAVFSTFAAIGFLADALGRGPYPLAYLAAAVTGIGLAAVGLAWCVTTQRYRLLPVVVVVQFGLIRLLPSQERLVGEELVGRVVLDATGALLCIVAGYAFFAHFIGREAVAALRVRTEIRLAREIHDQLVPDLHLRVGRYETYGRALPAFEVGGDLFDVMPAGSGVLAYLADVTGHGVHAGMLSGMTKAAARTRLLSEPGLSELLRDLHAVLTPLKSTAMFVTCAAVRLGADGRGELALAGHPPILRYAAAADRVERLGEPALPLGVVDSEWTSRPLEVAPGDVLAIVSDGLTEVFDAGDDEFGLEGVERVLRAHARRPLAELGQRIFDAARAHGPQLDDQTLLLIRVVE